jgi:hypothetical protein
MWGSQYSVCYTGQKTKNKSYPWLLIGSQGQKTLIVTAESNGTERMIPVISQMLRNLYFFSQKVVLDGGGGKRMGRVEANQTKKKKARGVVQAVENTCLAKGEDPSSIPSTATIKIQPIIYVCSFPTFFFSS